MKHSFWHCSHITSTTTILSVNWRHIRFIDLVSAKEKLKVSWLISFHSLIRQCFSILMQHCKPSRIRNIQIERLKQQSQQYTFFVFPLPKLGQWVWRQLTEIITATITITAAAAAVLLQLMMMMMMMMMAFVPNHHRVTICSGMSTELIKAVVRWRRRFPCVLTKYQGNHASVQDSPHVGQWESIVRFNRYVCIVICLECELC